MENLIFIPFYQEKLNKNALPYDNKDKILSFFRRTKCKPYCVAATTWYDIITNEKIGDNIYTYTDGKYEWCCDIPYCIEKYNYRLDKEHEDMILKELALN